MLSVPRVTMNGGSFTRVTSTPLSVPARAATTIPIASAATPGTPWSDGDLGHHHRRQDGDGPDRQVDAGGEDDDRLADGEGGDHRRLLQQQRDRRLGEEAGVDEVEDDARDHQDQRRADRGMLLDEVLYPLGDGVTAARQLLGGGGRALVPGLVGVRVARRSHTHWRTVAP